MGFRLPKCRWFQRRPRVGWFCRWVVGGVAVLAMAAWVFTLWWGAMWCVPRVGVAELHEGVLSVRSEPLDGFHTAMMRWSDFKHEGLHLRRRDEMFAPTSPLAPSGVRPLRLPSTIGTDTREFGELLRGMFSMPTGYVARKRPPTPWMFGVSVPLWLVAFITALPALAAWRSRWVAKREVGRCHTCGYSRDGLAPGAKCPECGNAPVA